MNAGREAAYKKLPAHEWLCEWSDWLREDSGFVVGGGGHPLARAMARGSVPAGRSLEFAEHRAVAVQQVITEMTVKSRDRTISRFRRQTLQLYVFLIKLEYVERRWNREEMVQHVQGKFGRPRYNDRSLLNNLEGAVAYVGILLGIGVSPH